MSITLVQGLGLTIMAMIVGIDFWLEALFIFRPIIVGTLAGMILGNVTLGMLCGGITELAFAGLTPAGGTQPPNPVLAAIMAVVIAYTTGAEASSAMAMALPFSFLMQYIILFTYSAFSLFMPRAEKAAKAAEPRTIGAISALCTGILALLYGIIVFLCAYVAQEPMKMLVESMPDWLTHGLEVAGGLLPAIGFAMLMRTMLSGEYMPYLLIGFVAACFIDFSNILPVAVIGTALALITYYRDKKEAEQQARINVNIEEDFEDGI